MSVIVGGHAGKPMAPFPSPFAPGGWGLMSGGPKNGGSMVLSTVVTQVGRTVEGVTDLVTAPFTDPVVRLGVTGLSRAGKTVFITSLVANLLNRGRMPQLAAAATGSISAAFLQPQPDDTVARFNYEAHLDALLGPDPKWPDGTSTVSELRLSFRVQPSGFIGSFSGPQTLHLDIIDYPGEWLLDLALLDKDYDTWAAEALTKAQARPQAAAYLAAVADLDPAQKFDDVTAGRLAELYASYLQTARADGYADCTPGRFLLPGDLAGSPALTFAPLPAADTGRSSLRREMARRYAAYQSRVVKPFFRDHFSKIDRQIVLVDVLKALSHGPRAVADLEDAMGDILAAFRPGRNGWLNEILLGKRVDRILFAATKADHLHHSQHPALAALAEAMALSARDKANFNGAQTAAMAIAALRTTTETEVADGLPAVQGTLLDSGKPAAFYPGTLPASPAGLLAEARSGADEWEDGDFAAMRFAPPKMDMAAGEGPPHIRLDKALQFLVGDKLG